MRHVLAASRRGYAGLIYELEKATGDSFALIEDPAEFTRENLECLSPRYIFLPHWSHIIPPEIHQHFECVVFHMTDLPFGRGGSPLQNLISRGIYETKLSALRCVSELDAGPIYLKRPLSLHGTAEEIFLRGATLVQEMIVEIVHTSSEPQPQQGDVVEFKRRRPEQSDIAGLTELHQVYDYIRMLDADGYPPAFIEVGGLRLEFSRAALKDGIIVADVCIREGKSMAKRVLVVAAHPDDEILGMGGTIARHSALGDTVHVLFLANGVGARGMDSAAEQRRMAAAQAACQCVGAVIAGSLDFPDNAFDSVPLLSLVKAIEDVKRQVDPVLVYTHHGGDLNIDHRITCQAVLTAFRPQPEELCRELLSFEVNSSTEWSHRSIGTPFLPDTYIDVSEYREQVLEAYRCYDEEMRPDPHARSPRALEIHLEHRGREVGLSAAEAFLTLRRIVGGAVDVRRS